MRDGYGRDIYYLRLSVKDLCNLRCVYCMPAQGVEKRRHEDILSIEELEEIALSAGRCGIRKIRLTGGEPLVRRGIVDICARTAAAPGVEEVCMTTNGPAPARPCGRPAPRGPAPGEYQSRHPLAGSATAR